MCRQHRLNPARFIQHAPLPYRNAFFGRRQVGTVRLIVTKYTSASTYVFVAYCGNWCSSQHSLAPYQLPVGTPPSIVTKHISTLARHSLLPYQRQVGTIRLIMTKDETPKCSGIALVRYLNRDDAVKALDAIPKEKVGQTDERRDRIDRHGRIHGHCIFDQG